ncbi:MAG: DUF2007 domain-containing protein [Verrucomicrobiales bacterium]|nr:DUF2007 domain-containing protein [Verrucomicrobiales bacterium]MCP5525461.1 DUF2007 domain-containing protein [Verrucomicrobiales bacterium]
MSLVTVFRAFNPIEAQLVRSRLDAAGIPVSVAHETATLTTEGYSGTTGGVLVQVPEESVADARALIESAAGESA